MVRKKKDKSKAVLEMKYNVVRRQRWETGLNVVSAFGLSVVSILLAFEQEDSITFLGIYVSLTVVFAAMGVTSIILYLLNIENIKKYQEDYNYYSESKKISDALLAAVKRTGYAKTTSILRSTYGTVPNWHPIDYCKNVLVYDVHEHLREICVRMKELIVNLNPKEFNDDMVTVDIAFEYPSDTEFITEQIDEVINSRANTKYGEKCPDALEGCNIEHLKERLKKELDREKPSEKCKIITSGDRTFSNGKLHRYLDDENSFYQYLNRHGYSFCNDKQKLADKNHYIWSSKDYEYNRIGSIVGTVIELKNDNPEKVFVRVYLTITTYGRKLVNDEDILDEEKFEKLFKETVINCYKTIIETELAQMFIRHGINNCFINRHTGRLIGKNAQIKKV